MSYCLAEWVYFMVTGVAKMRQILLIQEKVDLYGEFHIHFMHYIVVARKLRKLRIVS